MLRLPLEAIREVDGVREVHRAGGDVGLEQRQEPVLVRVADLALAQGEELGGYDLVNHVALEPADWLGLVDQDDVLV